MAKKQAKKRHIANSDTDSENSYPASQPTKSSSSTSTKKPYVPRFLIIHSEKEGETISSLSPFVVHKTKMSISGEPKSIKNLRSGDLLIQCAKEAHEKNLLQMMTFCGLKCSVKPHSSLNTSKDIIRCPALNRVTSDDIKEGMVEQGVTDVRRITVRRDGETKLTNTYVLTFNSPTLHTVVKIGFMQVKVDVYIPSKSGCKDQESIHLDVTVVKCLVTTKINVVDTLYAATAVSLNIVDHLACVTNQPNVPTALVITLQTRSNAHNGRKRRKFSKSNVKTTYHFLMLVNNTSNFTQVKLMQVLFKPGTCNKSTQTDNKSTQTDDSFTEYLKQTTKKTQGTKEKRNASPKPGKSNSSHSGPALKGATLEMIKKDEEKKKKEEKDKLKKQQKEERKQQWQKEQAQKEKEQTEKAKQAEKNPYSVFAEKDDEEVCMEEESVVFTDSSSSDHLPKGTLPRLPVTK